MPLGSFYKAMDVTCLYIAWPKTLQLRYSTRCSTQSTTSSLATALNRSFLSPTHPPYNVHQIRYLQSYFRSSGGLSHQGHRVGFRPDLRSLGLKSLINVRISPRSHLMSLHPPQLIYLKWTMTCSCRTRDRQLQNVGNWLTSLTIIAFYLNGLFQPSGFYI